MKKIYSILFILICINFFILIPKSYNTILNKDEINNYLQMENSENKEVLKKEIIKNVLGATKCENWEEYIDYIDLKIYKYKMPSKDKEFLFVALNLSKDSSVVGVYEDFSKYYTYKYKIGNLTKIKEISFFKDFIIINQILDERIGAFFVDDFIDIYYLGDKIPIKSFKKSIYYDEMYKNIWIKKDAPKDQWSKNIHKSSITYLNEDIPKILSISTQIKYDASSTDTPKETDFKETYKKSQKEIYYFDSISKEFKLQEKSNIEQ